jgi:hypothetical protein
MPNPDTAEFARQAFTNAATPVRNLRPILASVALLTIVAGAMGAILVRNSQLAQKTGLGAAPNSQMVQSPGANSANAGLVQSPGAAALNGGLVQAPGASQPSTMVQAPGEGSPNKMVQAPGNTEPVPQDVLDYLAFLKQIDAMRIHLERDEISSGLAMLPIAQSLGLSISDESKLKSSFEKIKGLPNQIANDWNQLTTLFQTKEPPASCQVLHDKYYDMLGKAQGLDESVASDLTNAMAQIFQGDSSNPNIDTQSIIKSLTNTQSKAPEVDAAASAADQSLADVCNKYHLNKDFDIKGDPSGASMFQQ